MKSMLRPLLIHRLAAAGHRSTIDTALVKFNDHIEKGSELNADLRPIIYGIVAQHNVKNGSQQLRHLFETATFSEVERNCIAAMAQATDKKGLKNFYDFAVRDGKIRTQDYGLIFEGARNHQIAQDFGWNYLRENIALFIERLGSVNSTIFQRLFKLAVDSQSDFKFAETFENSCKEIFDAAQLKVLQHMIGQCHENIRLNAQLLKNNFKVVEDYFKK